jgi:hypothetical protein
MYVGKLFAKKLLSNLSLKDCINYSDSQISVITETALKPPIHFIEISAFGGETKNLD